MSEASRYLSEYGDLSRLPLFNQHTNGTTPTPTQLGAPATAPHTADLDIDWLTVAELRARASEQLSQAVASDRSRLDRAAQHELGRSIVLDLIESAMADDVDAGRGAWPAAPSAVP